jgi:hypothetical protein
MPCETASPKHPAPLPTAPNGRLEGPRPRTIPPSPRPRPRPIRCLPTRRCRASVCSTPLTAPKPATPPQAKTLSDDTRRCYVTFTEEAPEAKVRAGGGRRVAGGGRRAGGGALTQALTAPRSCR